MSIKVSGFRQARLEILSMVEDQFIQLGARKMRLGANRHPPIEPRSAWGDRFRQERVREINTYEFYGSDEESRLLIYNGFRCSMGVFESGMVTHA